MCLVLLDDVGNCNVLHGHDLILSVNVFDVIIIICVCVRLRVLVSCKSCWARVSCCTGCLVHYTVTVRYIFVILS